MRKFLAATVAAVAFALAFVAAPAPVAQAQVPGAAFAPKKLTPVSSVRTAADTAPALYIKYYSGANTTASTSATSVAVAATSLTFVVNGVAYAGFEAPVSGALGGIIDMTDASADTLGEVVDIINSTPASFSTGYFRAAIAAGLRSDVVSTLAFVADAADTEVTRPEGEVIYWDSSVLDDEEIFFANDALGAQNSLNKRGVAQNPFANQYSFVQYASEKLTNAGTLSTFTCYAITENYKTGGGCNSSTNCGSGSEVVRTIYSEAAGATTVKADSTAEFPNGFFARDEKVFCRVTASGADSSAWELVISGFTFPVE